MALNTLVQRLRDADAFGPILTHLDRPEQHVIAPESLRAPLVAAIAQEHSEGSLQTLVLTATGREAESIAQALGWLLPQAEIIELPAWETLPHERLSPAPQTVGARLRAFRAMAARRDAAAAGERAQRPQIVVASVRAALQPVAANLASVGQVELAVGQQAELGDLVEQLTALAYARVDLVTRRGEFAVRGGIIDVFPPTEDYPFRIDFFGDEVDQIRRFQVADQRSENERIERVAFTASRELLLTDDVRRRAREMQHEFPNLQEMLEKLAEGIPVEGMESLSPALLDELVPITHYLADDADIDVLGPDRIRTRISGLVDTNREFLDAAWVAATAGADAPIDLSAGEYLDLDGLHAAAGGRHWLEVTPFEGEDDEAVEPDRFEAQPVPVTGGRANAMLEHVGERARDGWSVVLVVGGPGTAERARQVLAEAEIAASVVDDPELPRPGVVQVTVGELDEGFELAQLHLAVLTEAEFYGRAARYQQQPARKLVGRRRKNAVDPLQLKAGDYVVHDQHGIGRFVELTQRKVGATTRDYLLIEYAPSKRGYPGDKLYVPTDQLDQVTKYVGGEEPQLSKMGGTDWAKTKGRARKAVRDIAVELVKLYSARMASKGFAFSPDTPWQHELEQAFPYAETPDQMQTIEDVKRDMERAIPMDRLIAGDVGFGKTEIAVRAAFKAVQDGKQVVMLVPTTLLVKQHTETFLNRFAGFPVQVRALSRFQSAKEAKEILAGLADGSVDVVIATHRILGENVRFKSLGLVIIDEEQRFGVEHKDKLKKLKTNVDVLAMSATPIPRTLEMAVTGIREMSTLATPPEARHPVLTYVGAYSDRQVAAAIRRELLREGQVFFVHNRVTSINRVAAHLAELVPEARIAVAHGQMSESQLEQVIDDFWERRSDVLVCTTIIETGMDIQNANTLIVDRADKYGLSQLHQLRGRVGRGRERAYAYFLYDSERPLSETAHDRLETIAANNELGSGMQVAMKDLELRGAGNLLGGEQSGHIAGVGFDLYLRMIGEAVGAFRGENEEEAVELRLELPVDAHIPESYVESERLRLEAYQKLATASSPQGRAGGVEGVLEELVDRYGEPPQSVRNLVEVSRLKHALQGSGLSEVVAMGDKLRVAPVELLDSAQVRLARLYPKARVLAQSGTLLVPIPKELLGGADAAPLLDWVTNLLVGLQLVKRPEAGAGGSATAGGGAGAGGAH